MLEPGGGSNFDTWVMADFLALQLVLTARSGAPLRLMGHFVWPTYFLDPRGPRTHISCSHIRLSSPRFSLYIYLPAFAWSSRLLSACPFPFNIERALSTPTQLYASNPGVSFTIFLTLLTLLLRLLHLVSIASPVSSNATSPKALFPSLTSFPIPLMFSQFASQYSKNLVPHYSTPVVQRIPLYLTSLAVPESLVLLSVSPPIVCHRLLLASTLPHHRYRRRARFARHLHHLFIALVTRTGYVTCDVPY